MFIELWKYDFLEMNMSERLCDEKHMKKTLLNFKKGLEAHHLRLFARVAGTDTEIKSASIATLARKAVRYTRNGAELYVMSEKQFIVFEHSLKEGSICRLIDEFPIPPTFIFPTGKDKAKLCYELTEPYREQIGVVAKELSIAFKTFVGIRSKIELQNTFLQQGMTLNKEYQAVLGRRYRLSEFVYFFGVKSWLEPSPLDHSSDANMKMNKSHMPSLLYQYCWRHANLVPCPMDYFFVPLVVVLGSLIGHKLHIKPQLDNSMLVTPILWGLYIGQSGSGKTPAFESVMGLLQPIIEREETRVAKENCGANSDSEVRLIEKRLEIESVRKEIKFAKDLNDTYEYKRAVAEGKQKLEKLSDERKSSSKRRYKTTNVTLASIIKILAENPNGVILAIDELKGLLARLSSKHHEELRAFLLECARGFGTYDSDRITTGQQSLVNMALSIVGGIQPDSFGPHLSRVISGTSDNDGWLHRFTVLSAPSPVELIEPEIPRPTNKLNNAMQSLLFGIDDFRFGFAEGTPVKERFLRFSNDAQAIYDSWITEHIVKRSKYSSLMNSHLRKYDASLPALSLIYEVVLAFDNEHQRLRPVTKVGAKAITYAVNTFHYLEQHAEQILGQHESITINNAQHLLEMLPTMTREQFTASEISQLGWSGMNRETEQVSEALEILENHFYVRKVKPIPGKRGRRTVLWERNPLMLL